MNKREKKELKKRVGYLFQNVALFDSMNTYDNIALPLRENFNYTETEIKNIVYDKLEKLEITAIVNKYPSEISGGLLNSISATENGTMFSPTSLLIFCIKFHLLDPAFLLDIKFSKSYFI